LELWVIWLLTLSDILYIVQRPTALAKIYGFFKIGFRNATTGRSLRMNVLIMENLFYERRFDRVSRDVKAKGTFSF
jgi:hypothetical protein